MSRLRSGLCLEDGRTDGALVASPPSRARTPTKYQLFRRRDVTVHHDFDLPQRVLVGVRGIGHNAIGGSEALELAPIGVIGGKHTPKTPPPPPPPQPPTPSR